MSKIKVTKQSGGYGGVSYGRGADGKQYMVNDNTGFAQETLQSQRQSAAKAERNANGANMNSSYNSAGDGIGGSAGSDMLFTTAAGIIVTAGIGKFLISLIKWLWKPFVLFVGFPYMVWSYATENTVALSRYVVPALAAIWLVVLIVNMVRIITKRVPAGFGMVVYSFLLGAFIGFGGQGDIVGAITALVAGALLAGATKGFLDFLKRWKGIE